MFLFFLLYMQEQVVDYIEKHNLLRPTDKVIVGFSGGADSVALLYILHSLRYNCVAAHCNFHLRGEESNRDERFARDFAAMLDIPFVKTDFDTVGYAEENKISIEMAARELRYDWFEKIRLEEKADVVAVAHHNDDHVETILLNLIRGTGLRGLTGMPPKRESIIRPLLSVSRKELEAFLSERGLKYVDDSTNATDVYLRNFVRLRLIPMLSTLNPAVKSAIDRMSHHLVGVEAIYNDYMEQTLESVMSDCHISIAKLQATIAPEAVLFELLTPYGYTPSQLEDVYRALNGESGKVFKSPVGDTILIKDRESLILTKDVSKDNQVYRIEGERLEYPIRLLLSKVPIDETFRIFKEKHIAVLDADKVIEPLSLRTWKDGDWFVPFGMKGRKKLSDFYTDRKFSLEEKDQTWLLCSGEDILWVVGERIDQRYSISKASKNALIVNFSR